MTGPSDPATWDVIPRAWNYINHPTAGPVVAALMPYPGRHAEDRACTGDGRYLDDKALMSSSVRTDMANTCAGCKVVTACREYAVAHEEYGMWGGTMPNDRAYVRKRRRQVLVPPEIAHVYGLSDDPFAYLVGVNHAEDQADRTQGCDAVA